MACPLTLSYCLPRYLIFFCPMDLFYKCVCFLPVKLIFVAMKEVVRVRKIAVGIHHAHHHYHHGWFVMIATGWVKGRQAPKSPPLRALLGWPQSLLQAQVWTPRVGGPGLPQGISKRIARYKSVSPR